MSTQDEVLIALRRAAAAFAAVRQLAGLPGFFGKDGRMAAIQRYACDEAHAAFDVSNQADSAAVYKAAEVLVSEMRVLIALNDTPKLEAIILAWYEASKRQQEEEWLGLTGALRRAGLMLVSICLLDETWRKKWGKTKTEQLGAAEVMARMELEATEVAIATALTQHARDELAGKIKQGFAEELKKVGATEEEIRAGITEAEWAARTEQTKAILKRMDKQLTALEPMTTEVLTSRLELIQHAEEGVRQLSGFMERTEAELEQVEQAIAEEVAAKALEWAYSWAATNKAEDEMVQDIIARGTIEEAATDMSGRGQARTWTALAKAVEDRRSLSRGTLLQSIDIPARAAQRVAAEMERRKAARDRVDRSWPWERVMAGMSSATWTDILEEASRAWADTGLMEEEMALKMVAWAEAEAMAEGSTVNDLAAAQMKLADAVEGLAQTERQLAPVAGAARIVGEGLYRATDETVMDDLATLEKELRATMSERAANL